MSFTDLLGNTAGLDNTTKLQVSLYGKNAAAGDTAINVLAATSVSNSLSNQSAGLIAGADQEVSFSTTTAQAVATTDVTNYRWVSVQVTSQGTGSTVTFQVSNDNSTWVSASLMPSTNTVGSGVTSTTSTGLYHGPLSGRNFRLNVTGISAGTTSGIVEFHTVPIATLTSGNVVGSAASSPVNPTTASHTISAASTNATNLKASGGQIYRIICTNAAASVRYLKLYNKATAPTVGTDTPTKTIGIQPNAPPFVLESTIGMRFGTGIGFGTTTGIADSDTGAVGANDLAIDIDYI